MAGLAGAARYARGRRPVRSEILAQRAARGIDELVEAERRDVMTIQHHPSDELLTAFAAGTLDQGQHVAIATHLLGCSHCRGWMHAMEHVGGKVLADLAPTAMSRDAFARIEARLHEPVQATKPAARSVRASLDDVAGLPAFVRRYPAGPWKWIAPRVHLRPTSTLADDVAADAAVVDSVATTAMPMSFEQAQLGANVTDPLLSRRRWPNGPGTEGHRIRGATQSACYGHATDGLSAYYPGRISTVTAIFPARIFKILCGFFRPEFSYIFSDHSRLQHLPRLLQPKSWLPLF